jgi:hypothetical protein
MKNLIEKPKHIELPINNRLNRMNERAKKIELLASQAFKKIKYLNYYIWI